MNLRMRSKPWSAGLLACLLGFSTLLISASAAPTTKMKCVEGQPYYFHMDEAATTDPAAVAPGSFSQEEPQNSAPVVRPLVGAVGGVAPEWQASFDDVLCDDLKVSLYVAAPTGETPREKTLIVNACFHTPGSCNYSSQQLSLELTPTPVEVNVTIPAPQRHPDQSTLRFTAWANVLDLNPGPVVIAYDHVDFPARFVASTWVPCEDGDPDPQCE